MITAQFYDTGRMHWTYSCTSSTDCKVEVYFEMKDTCCLGALDKTSIMEVQVRVGIVTTAGVEGYKNAILSRSPGQYEISVPFTPFAKRAPQTAPNVYTFTEGCIGPDTSGSNQSNCDKQTIEEGDKICIAAHLNACKYCQDQVLTETE